MVPVPSSQPMYGRCPAVAEAMTRLWTEATGETSPPCPATLEILLGQACVESGCNPANPKGGLGAHQCTKHDEANPAPYFTCFKSTDTSPSNTQPGVNTTYEVSFRQFKDAPGPDGTMRPASDWAAYDFLRSIAHDRPTSFAAAKSGNINTYCAALYDSHYYQGYGTTREERIAGYDKGIRSHVPHIAAALGHARVYAS